jgi:hypothetical protein
MTEPIIFLSSNKDSIEDSHILMTLRNMGGQDLHLAVKRKAIVWDVRHHVAIQMGLISSNIHLVLDYKELDNTDRIYTIQPLLESKSNVVDLLIDVQELPPLMFVCLHCNRECDIWECVDWSDDPSAPCNHPDGAEHYCMCCYGQWHGNGQEEQEQEEQEEQNNEDNE